MNAIIFSITSDIGFAIAQDWIEKGYRIAGTYRTGSKKINYLKKRGVKLFKCKIDDYKNVNITSKKLVSFLNGIF